MKMGMINLKIMKSRDKDKDTLIKMWEYCFDDTNEFVDWYFKTKYSAENTIGVYEDERMVSSLHILPYSMNFCDRTINTRYVVGVASFPENRGKGYVSELMKETIKIMNNENTIISLLLPFEYNYYRRYGWDTCYSHKKYEIPLKELRGIGKNYGRFRKVKKPEDIELLNSIYKYYTLEKHGYIVRSKKDWESILYDAELEGYNAYILEKQGSPEGYIIYALKNDSMLVHEMSYSNPDAFNSLIRFIINHYSQVQKLIWNAPEDDKLYLKLTNNSSITISPFVMARVINVKEVLKILIQNTNCDVNFTLCIEDNLASWNNKVFKIDGSKVSELISCHSDIIMSINTFTQIAMGYISSFEAFALGLLISNSKEKLQESDKIFKTKENYINEYY